MKKIALFFSFILLALLSLSPFGCKGSQIMSFTAFNTAIRIEAHDKAISKDTQDKLNELFTWFEKEFDTNDDSSFLHALNSASANTPVELSTTAKEVLSLAKDYYIFTNGKYNPAVKPLVGLWQFDNFNSVVGLSLPTQEQITNLLKTVDFDSVKIEDKFVYKTKSTTQIDLGGLVKGYAVDKALEIMKEAGHEKGYVNIGASSMALLQVEKLNVSHPRPDENNEILLSVNCNDKANVTLSTSGDYQRYFIVDGVRYSHIINPLTGYPVQTNVASATVIGGTGAFSDAITTALCASNHSPDDFNNSELVALMKKIIALYNEIEIYAVYDDGQNKQLLTNKKQGDNFTLLDDNYKVYLI